ncbi:MAG: sensor histidine kinase [Roseburia sp.]|nr:sensor histidine kinase [Roseburia sp.]
MEHNEKYYSLDIKEKERQRIARDLHDITLQSLTHLIHKVELSSLYMDQDIVKAKLELATVEKELRQMMDDMRTIIYNLHPVTLDDLGLKATIEKALYEANKNYKFFIEMDIDDVSCENEIIQITILRLIQECYFNALKHSKGNELFVSLKSAENKYIIKVRDNGTGFDENEIDNKGSHFGLSIMRERVDLLNGKMNINSSEKGTSIIIEIPF